MAKYYNERRKDASRKYQASHIKQTKLDLSLEHDADILARLDAVPNKQGYIKDLIRADIARNPSTQPTQNMKKEDSTMKYQVEYTDPRTGATSPIDTISAPAGYTADDYIRDCDANADPDWCEMLHAGTVSLEPVEEI